MVLYRRTGWRQKQCVFRIVGHAAMVLFDSSSCSGGSGGEGGEAKRFLSGLCRQSTVVVLRRGTTSQGRVRALGAPKRHPPGNHLLVLEAVQELMQVGGFVLEGTPQALGEDVAHAPARAVHGIGNPGVLDHGGQLQAGELTALIGVEDFGAAIALQGGCEGIDAEAVCTGLKRGESNFGSPKRGALHSAVPPASRTAIPSALAPATSPTESNPSPARLACRPYLAVQPLRRQSSSRASMVPWYGSSL